MLWKVTLQQSIYQESDTPYSSPGPYTSAILLSQPIMERCCSMSGQDWQQCLALPVIPRSWCRGEGSINSLIHSPLHWKRAHGKQNGPGEEETAQLSGHSFSHPAEASRAGSQRGQLPRVVTLTGPWVTPRDPASSSQPESRAKSCLWEQHSSFEKGIAEHWYLNTDQTLSRDGEESAPKHSPVVLEQGINWIKHAELLPCPVHQGEVSTRAQSKSSV